MRPAGRVRFRVLALLLVLLTVLLGSPTTAGAREDGGNTAADRVVVVGVPGLTWSDVDPEGTPELWALAGESSIGAMSVRGARSTTCLLDGWATLGAGNRARVPGPDEGLPPVPVPSVPLPEDPAAPTAPPTTPGDQTAPDRVDTSLSYCGLQERTAEEALLEPEATVARTAADEGTARFGAEPAALGQAVGCATVSGRAATLAVALPGVKITRAEMLPAQAEPLARALTNCPLALVTLDQLTDAGKPGTEKTDDGTDPEPRAAALLRIDGAVGHLREVLATLPGDTLLMLVGISEVNDGRPQLHVGMASGPGFSPTGWLTSASTGRPPFVQLIDVAPTALRALGLDQPASMNGQPMRSTGERPALESAVAELEAVNTAATIHHRNTGFFFWTLVLVSAVLVGLGMLVLGGVPGLQPRRSAVGRRALRTGGDRRGGAAGGHLSGRGLPVGARGRAGSRAVGRRAGRRPARPGAGPRRAVAAAPPGPAARRPRRDVRNARGRRAHRVDAGAQRAVGLRRGRRRPLHRLRQPQLRPAVGQRPVRHRGGGHRPGPPGAPPPAPGS